MRNKRSIFNDVRGLFGRLGERLGTGNVNKSWSKTEVQEGNCLSLDRPNGGTIGALLVTSSSCLVSSVSSLGTGNVNKSGSNTEDLEVVLVSFKSR